MSLKTGLGGTQQAETTGHSHQLLGVTENANWYNMKTTQVVLFYIYWIYCLRISHGIRFTSFVCQWFCHVFLTFLMNLRFVNYSICSVLRLSNRSECRVELGATFAWSCAVTPWSHRASQKCARRCWVSGLMVGNKSLPVLKSLLQQTAAILRDQRTSCSNDNNF